MNNPTFILVAPQMGENIGAAARAMANFGLDDLRLVAPRDGWPNPAADTMSAGALPDVVKVQVFDTVEAAMADCSFVIATTARPRGMEKQVYETSEAISELKSSSQKNQNAKPAVLFGAEKSGLPNEAVTLANAILSFPVNPNFSSLNLAQSVVLVAHAWGEAVAADQSALASNTAGSATDMNEAALRDELVGMMEHFEDELTRAGFFFPEVKKPVMVQNLRNAFTRAEWTSQEVQTFRGAIKALAIGRGKARVVRED